MTRYYTKRPAGPGSIPTTNLTNIVGLDPNEIAPGYNRGFYNIVEYSEPLSENDIRCYEMFPVELPADIKHMGYTIKFNPYGRKWEIYDGDRFTGATRRTVAACIALIDSAA